MLDMTLEDLYTNDFLSEARQVMKEVRPSLRNSRAPSNYKQI